MATESSARWGRRGAMTNLGGGEFGANEAHGGGGWR